MVRLEQIERNGMRLIFAGCLVWGISMAVSIVVEIPDVFGLFGMSLAFLGIVQHCYSLAYRKQGALFTNWLFPVAATILIGYFTFRGLNDSKVATVFLAIALAVVASVLLNLAFNSLLSEQKNREMHGKDKGKDPDSDS